jgi:geranylgeranyl diphosphate synthase type II
MTESIIQTDRRGLEDLFKRVKTVILPDTKKKVWPEIQKFLPEGEPAEFYEIVSDYPKRQGKYLRPALVLVACETLSGEKDQAIRSAAAMQTSEDWILMRDDWQDGSLERRNKPCSHRIYGDFKANNAADGLHIVMWNMLNKNDDIIGYEKGRKVRDLFYPMLLKTVEGQHREIDWTEKGKIGLSPEEWYQIADTKTGRYTIILPMQLGAIVAGADKRLDDIFDLGIILGRAFQLRDDILNVAGDEKKYGKEIGGDIIEGKRTVLLGHLYNNCSDNHRKFLDDFFAKPRKDRSVEESYQIITLMKNYGSIKYSQELAEENAATAMKIFDDKFGDVPETKAKSELRDLITFMAYRDQ